MLILGLLFEAKTHKVERHFFTKPIVMESSIPINQVCLEQGWTNCLSKLDIHADVYFYGNSITQISDFQQDFPWVTVVNLGVGGNSLDDLFRRIPMVQAVHPKSVFVMGGINGLLNITMDSFEVKYTRLVQALCDSLPSTKIVLQSMLPINHNRYGDYGNNLKISSCNALIEKIANKFECEYVDLFSLYIHDGEMPDSLTQDGIHLLPKHYDRWATRIRPMVEEFR